MLNLIRNYTSRLKHISKFAILSSAFLLNNKKIQCTQQTRHFSRQNNKIHKKSIKNKTHNGRLTPVGRTVRGAQGWRTLLQIPRLVVVKGGRTDAQRVDGRCVAVARAAVQETAAVARRPDENVAATFATLLFATGFRHQICIFGFYS